MKQSGNAQIPSDSRTPSGILAGRVMPIRRADAAAAIVLALVIASASLIGFKALRPAVLDTSTFNYLFDADPSSIYQQMSTRDGIVHRRTSRHPVFSLASGLPLTKAQQVTGISRLTLVSCWMAVVSALWTLLLFAALRGIGLPVGSATTFSLIGALSAAGVFNLPVPGHIVLGSTTMLAALVTIAAGEKRLRWSPWILLAVSALTLAVTTTNWMAGLALLFVAVGFRRGAMLALASLGLIAVLALIQQRLVPGSEHFLLPRGEGQYVFNPMAGGPLHIAGVFLWSSVVMPPIYEMTGPVQLSVQRALPGSGSIVMALATGLWTAALVASALSWRSWIARPTGQVILIVLAGQALLHFVFGTETFLFAFHWVPFLVAFVALGATVRPRLFAAGAAVLALLLTINNLAAFAEARTRLNRQYADQWAFVTAARLTTDSTALIIRGHSRLHEDLDESSLREPVTAEPRRLVWRVGEAGHASHMYRMGWSMWYEQWSRDRVEEARRRGARYFMTTYQRGLIEPAPFIDDLTSRYSTLAREDGFVIIDLWQAARSGEPLSSQGLQGP